MDMNTLQTTLDNVFNNKMVVTFLSIILALYAGALAPALPNKVILVADTLLGKLFFVFLIAYVSSKNIQLSIMISLAFVVTLTAINKYKIEESFQEHFNQMENLMEHKNNYDHVDDDNEVHDIMFQDEPTGSVDSPQETPPNITEGDKNLESNIEMEHEPVEYDQPVENDEPEGFTNPTTIYPANNLAGNFKDMFAPFI